MCNKCSFDSSFMCSLQPVPWIMLLLLWLLYIVHALKVQYFVNEENAVLCSDRALIAEISAVLQKYQRVPWNFAYFETGLFPLCENILIFCR